MRLYLTFLPLVEPIPSIIVVVIGFGPDGRKWFWRQLNNSRRSPPIGGAGKMPATKIWPKAIWSGIFRRFPNFDKCQLEVAGDIISCVAVEYVDMYVSALWVKQWPNYFTLWRTTAILCITFVQYLFAFCSQLEAYSNVIFGKFVGPLIPNNHVKFCDTRMNLSQEIPPETVWGGIFDGFDGFFFTVASETELVSDQPVGGWLKYHARSIPLGGENGSIVYIVFLGETRLRFALLG